jgi:hypothetical protein
MLLDYYQMVFIQMMSYVSLFITLCIFLYIMLKRIAFRRNRWRYFRYQNMEFRVVNSPLILKLFSLHADHHQMVARRTLLQECGWHIQPIFYEFIRRFGCIITGTVVCLSYFSFRYPILIFYANPIFIGLFSLILLIFLGNDKKILEQIRQLRREQIVKEINEVSHQLLYYTNSQLNLHAKLSKCTSLTKTIRQPFEYLLNEWYQDAEQAIYTFKQRVSTEEAHRFAETLQAIRLNESESYYHLLKQRIQDFKEQIELSKDSRKETVSYVLFIIAGIPIMNTFRVFMYPWIAEGQKLFNGLN